MKIKDIVITLILITIVFWSIFWVLIDIKNKSKKEVIVKTYYISIQSGDTLGIKTDERGISTYYKLTKNDTFK